VQNAAIMLQKPDNWIYTVYDCDA